MVEGEVPTREGPRTSRTKEARKAEQCDEGAKEQRVTRRHRKGAEKETDLSWQRDDDRRSERVGPAWDRFEISDGLRVDVASLTLFLQ